MICYDCKEICKTLCQFHSLSTEVYCWVWMYQRRMGPQSDTSSSHCQQQWNCGRKFYCLFLLQSHSMYHFWLEIILSSHSQCSVAISGSKITSKPSVIIADCSFTTICYIHQVDVFCSESAHWLLFVASKIHLIILFWQSYLMKWLLLHYIISTQLHLLLLPLCLFTETSIEHIRKSG